MAKTEVYGANPNAWVVEDMPDHPGDIWFVDSNAVGAADDAAHGYSPATPILSLDYAIGRCTANHGDTIYLMPAHAETIAAAAASPNLDVAGVSVIGLGHGANRPTFTFTHNDANIILAADNCVIENLLLLVGVDGVDELVDVNAAGCRIESCEFREGAAQQVTNYIMINCAANAADRTVIRGCKMTSLAVGADSGIKVATNVQKGCVIENNLIYGHFTNGGAIWTQPIITDFLIRNNMLGNTNAAGLSLAIGPGTGMFIGNRIVDTSGAVWLFFGSMFCLDNQVVGAIDTSSVFAPYISSSSLWPSGYVDADSLAVSAGEKTADGVVVTRATAALPQTASGALFTVTGRVLLKRVVGVVTTAIGAVPNVTHLQLNSTGAGATTDLCLAAGGLDVDGDVADTNYTITGTFADAMVATLDLPMVSTAYEIVLPPGSLEVDCAGSDGGGGRVRWTATYVPLEDGARITAA